jgi:peptidoglycan lytic transglycosylase A
VRLIAGSPFSSSPLASAVALAVLLALLSSCRPSPPPPTAPVPTPTPAAPPAADLVRVDPPTIVDDLPRESLIAAIDQDVVAGRRLAALDCPAAKFADALLALRESALQPTSDLAATVRSTFDFYRSTGRHGGALFTGYYQPIVEGRRQRTGAFSYALYRRPDDLVEVPLGDFSAAWTGITLHGRVERGKLAPYYSRREIDGEHALDGRGLELVWLDDPVARYFLQVQGSGIVHLEDGSSLQVGFAGSNGRPYTSIGRVLADSGVLAEPPTAPAIQRYLRAHPDLRDGVLFRNPRYVFFRETPAGPVGTLGVTLTAGRSIAVDASHYPLGALAYVVTEPRVAGGPAAPAVRPPVRRLVLAQDTGAAISGPGRIDLFFGSGEVAGLEAGTLSVRGDLYLLAPRACR